MVAQGATYDETITCWVDKFEEYLVLYNTGVRSAAEAVELAAQIEAAKLDPDYAVAVAANEATIAARRQV